MAQNDGDFFKGLVFGSLIGAIIGILYAPKKGRETREELTRRADELISRAKEEYEKNREDYEAVFESIKEVGAALRNKASKTEKKIGELSLSGKKTADEKKKRLKKALDAGVDAYREKKQQKRS